MTLTNWYNFGVRIIEPEQEWNPVMCDSDDYREKYRNSLIHLYKLMRRAEIKDWWFLHYGSDIRVRFKRTRKNRDWIEYMVGKNNITKYYEEPTKWKTKDELQAFVKIMQICKDLVKLRIEDPSVLDVGRFNERTWHCMWNNLHGIGMETRFLTELLDNKADLSKVDTEKFNKAVFEI